MSEETGTISAAQAAKLLMLTTERLRQLARDGVIPKAGRGRYPLVGVVQGYLEFLRGAGRRAARSLADSGLAAAKTREVELRIAEREGKIIETDDVERTCDAVLATYGEELTAAAAEVAAAHPTAAEQFARHAQEAIARARQRFADAIIDLRAGRDPVA